MPPSRGIKLALEDIATVEVGGTPSTKVPAFWNGSIPFVTPTDITSLIDPVLTSTARTITEDGLANTSGRLIPQGSVLVATRATIGPAAIAGTNLAANQGITALIPHTDVDSYWLYYWVCANRQEFISRGAGNTFQEVARTKSRQIPVFLPEINIQRRIGDLGRSFDQTYVALHREKASGIRIKQTIADSVWEADVPFVHLATLGETSTGKTPPTKEDRYWAPADVPFFTPGDFDGTLELESANRAVSAAGSVVARCRPANTVAQVCIGATLGKTATFKVPATANQQINCLSGLDREDAIFLATILGSPAGERGARRRASQTTLPILKKSAWETWMVPWPSRKRREQLGTLFRDLDRVSRASIESIRNLMVLRDSIIGELYRGTHSIPDTYDHLLFESSR